jgi:YggT family protein
MRAVLDVIMLALNLYWWIIIISAILSWLVAFNVINPRNEVVGTIGRVVYGLTEPVLRPIRRFLPNLGGIDISPIILLLGIYFLQQIIIRYVYPNVF